MVRLCELTGFPFLLNFNRTFFFREGFKEGRDRKSMSNVKVSIKPSSILLQWKVNQMLRYSGTCWCASREYLLTINNKLNNNLFLRSREILKINFDFGVYFNCQFKTRWILVWIFRSSENFANQRDFLVVLPRRTTFR